MTDRPGPCRPIWRSVAGRSVACVRGRASVHPISAGTRLVCAREEPESERAGRGADLGSVALPIAGVCLGGRGGGCRRLERDGAEEPGAIGRCVVGLGGIAGLGWSCERHDTWCSAAACDEAEAASLAPVIGPAPICLVAYDAPQRQDAPRRLRDRGVAVSLPVVPVVPLGSSTRLTLRPTSVFCASALRHKLRPWLRCPHFPSLNLLRPLDSAISRHITQPVAIGPALTAAPLPPRCRQDAPAARHEQEPCGYGAGVQEHCCAGGVSSSAAGGVVRCAVWCELQ